MKPRLLVKRLVEIAMRNLNSFRAEKGISDTLSLLAIVGRATTPDARAFSLNFGAHVETFEDKSWF